MLVVCECCAPASTAEFCNEQIYTYCPVHRASFVLYHICYIEVSWNIIDTSHHGDGAGETRRLWPRLLCVCRSAVCGPIATAWMGPAAAAAAAHIAPNTALLSVKPVRRVCKFVCV